MATNDMERVCVRSVIKIGSIMVKTPYIQSFNVKKQRGQISSFDASLKISCEEISDTNMSGGCVKIYAGYSDGREETQWWNMIGEPSPINGIFIPIIFTGIIKTAKMTPCFDDPKYIILSISGTDVLGLLEGKKFTRRNRATISSWVAITGVNPGLKSDKLTHKNTPLMETNGDGSFADTNLVFAPPTTIAGAPPANYNRVIGNDIVVDTADSVGQ